MRIDDITLALHVTEGNPEKNGLNFLSIGMGTQIRMKLKENKRETPSESAL